MFAFIIIWKHSAALLYEYNYFNKDNIKLAKERLNPSTLNARKRLLIAAADSREEPIKFPFDPCINVREAPSMYIHNRDILYAFLKGSRREIRGFFQPR